MATNKKKTAEKTDPKTPSRYMQLFAIVVDVEKTENMDRETAIAYLTTVLVHLAINVGRDTV